jgi:hypothetical protein
LIRIHEYAIMINTHAYSRPAGVATLAIGVISGFIPTLQGTLLPQLVTEGHLTLAALGQAAMAEAIGTLVAVALATALLEPTRLRPVTAASAAIGMLLDLATAHLHGVEILAARFAHGLCAGMLLWLWVGFLTRQANPGRWVAAFVTAQSATVMVLSYWFAVALLPAGGALAGYAVVAVLYGALVGAAWLVPPAFPPLVRDGGSLVPGVKGWIGLLAVFCQIAAILSLWIYLKPLGQQGGLSDTEIGFAITLAMASQIPAGLCATPVVGRVSSSALLAAASALSIAAIAGLGLMGGNGFVFALGVVVFGFFWVFSVPFMMPYLIDVDPSRRAAVHMSTAMLVGVALGPALASLAVGRHGVTGALWVAGVLYGLTGLVVLFNRPAREPA